MNAEKMFERHAQEFLKFDRIPKPDRRHPRPDLCAMLYLHERFGGGGDAVCHAEHDEIWLAWEVDDVTEEDVIYITRCGVRLDSVNGLCMFV